MGVRVFLVVFLSCFCSACAYFGKGTSGTPTIAGNSLLGVKHPFVIFVANNAKLKASVEKMLTEQRATNSKYLRASSLRTSTKYDQELIHTFLRSLGYYQAKVESNASGEEQVAHQIFPGSRFKITEIKFDWPDNVTKPPADVVKVKIGDPLIAQRILDAVSDIRRWVANEHCLRTIDVNYLAVVHHPTKSATITLILKPSPQVVFGKVSYSGDDSIQPRYLDGYLGFSEGDCFKPRLLDSTRLKLIQTNLLANADPVAGDIVDGAVPVLFRLTERKQRSLSVAVGYDADIRANLALGWEHRNMFGRGERLATELTLSSISKGLETKLSVPHFYSPKQLLTITANVAEETPDAYDVYLGEVGADLKREITDKFSVNVGSNIKFSRILELETPEEYALFSVPLGVEYSARDEQLNPTKGWAAGFNVEPFQDLYQSSLRFRRSTVGASTYLTANNIALKPTLAMRVASGVIEGAPLEDIPADERFFSGGGGSVRGYKYQSIGEINSEGNPAGGLSFSEVSIEVRSRFTQSIGVTLFLDGGYAYPTVSPKFGDDFLWGAGIGLRYHTAFAPFRFDLATPLNKREGDSDVQVYVSIGQAF